MDDLESLMYILCYLISGTLPVVDFINENIDKFQMNQFLHKILSFRTENKKECKEKIV